MTVKLYSSQRSYIGESTDTKPVTGGADGTIPTGSTFVESDTGRRFAWNGYRWTLAATDIDNTDILTRLDQVVAELKQTNEILLAVMARF